MCRLWGREVGLREVAAGCWGRISKEIQDVVSCVECHNTRDVIRTRH